jgi:hypothetical protein
MECEEGEEMEERVTENMLWKNMKELYKCEGKKTPTR